MIISRLNGGLGNQMFQYAIARKLALEHKTIVKLDLEDYSNAGVHPFCLNNFNAPFKLAKNLDLAYFGKIPDFGNPLWLRIKRRIFPVSDIFEKEFNYHPEIFKQTSRNTYINGYWQTEKYFADIRNILLKDFSPAHKVSDKTTKILNEIEKRSSISVHIRRGDYVLNKSTNDFHGTCSLEYYRHASQLILGKINEPTFFVFSDDIEWAKLNVELGCETYFVDHNNVNTAWEDLLLMSKCKHNIIANSTFSWWGAWLNTHAEKIVIAPSKWFNNAKLDYSDVICDEWLRI